MFKIITSILKSANEILKNLIAIEIKAANGNPWISGGRAFLIWICDICVALYWIPQYTLASWFWIRNCVNAGKFLPYPLNGASLVQLLICLLGLVGIRFITKKRNK